MKFKKNAIFFEPPLSIKPHLDGSNTKYRSIYHETSYHCRLRLTFALASRRHSGQDLHYIKVNTLNFVYLAESPDNITFRCLVREKVSCEQTHHPDQYPDSASATLSARENNLSNQPTVY